MIDRVCEFKGQETSQSENSTDYIENFVFACIFKRSFRHVYKLLFKQQATANKNMRAGVNNVFM